MPNWREKSKPYRLLLALAIAVLALFVWPTPYSYRVAPVENEFAVLRINRITGRITAMFPGGRRLKVNPGWFSELEMKLYSGKVLKKTTGTPAPGVVQSGSSQPSAFSHGNMSIAEFAAKARAIRPDLAKIPDEEIVGKVIEVAPQFQRYLSYEAQAQLLRYELRKMKSKGVSRSRKLAGKLHKPKARERK